MKLRDKLDLADLAGPRTARFLAVLLTIIFLLGLLVAALYGPPRKLPGIAMGWTVLLYVERAAAGAGLVGVVSIVILNTVGGLPSELGTSGMKWPASTPQVEQMREVVDAGRTVVNELKAFASVQAATPEDAERLVEVEQTVEKMDDAVTAAEQDQAIRAAIAELEPLEHEVITRMFWKSQPTGQIAMELKLPLDTIRAFYRNAVFKLQQELGVGDAEAIITQLAARDNDQTERVLKLMQRHAREKARREAAS